MTPCFKTQWLTTKCPEGFKPKLALDGVKKKMKANDVKAEVEGDYVDVNELSFVFNSSL